jgi:hypothetical protein
MNWVIKTTYNNERNVIAMKKNVFILWESMVDYNETNMHGGLNEDVNWSIFRDIAEGKVSVKDYKRKV